ncbi:MAG: hypothetical protein QXN46_02420, partial [Candidatus Woesearchaeota archaeon]
LTKKPSEKELFKWFLAAILFGKPIQFGVAKRTFQLFILRKLTSPKAILVTGWDRLVELLDLGGYVRYDFSTATKLLEVMQKLQKDYAGSLWKLHESAADSADLEKRLMDFKGIGPVTTNIFLRELRAVWPKADPEPLPAVKEMARKLKIKLPKNRKADTFIRIEASLIRKWLASKHKKRQV